MSKIVILSQEIAAESIDEVQNDVIFRPIKAQFVKKCVLEAVHQFTKSSDIPRELHGYMLHFETEIKNSDLAQYSDDELSLWFDQKILCLQQRERIYIHWYRSAQINKLSIILSRLKLRIFSVDYEESNEIESIMAEAKKTLKNQIEKELIIQVFQKTMALYQTGSYWPISEQRTSQQQELLSQIKQAPDARSVLNIMRQAIINIEQQHICNSVAANLPSYQRKSRLVCYLYQASSEISTKLKLNTQHSTVEKCVEQAIAYYLSEDIFYHNRNRRIVAQQLLTQLHADQLLFRDDQVIERKYKMRTTLEHYIKKIDSDFKSTHFFTCFYKTKRSRLTRHLEIIKETLINNDYLSELELEDQIKQPILNFIKTLITTDLDAELQRAINSLGQELNQAQTPYAIEAILEAHIRSCLQQATNSDFLLCFKNFLTGQENEYFMIAVKLESALLDWQAKRMLPAASGYRSFLHALALDRQNTENDLQRLERQYQIKIPRNLEAMHQQQNKIMNQAYTLLQRIKSM